MKKVDYKEEDALVEPILDMYIIYIKKDTLFAQNIKRIHELSLDKKKKKSIINEILKFSVNRLPLSKQLIIADINTILSAPQVFVHNKKMVYLHSDDYYYPNIIHIMELLKIEPRAQLSFISNQFIIDLKRLNELKNEIEEIHHKKWYEAIFNVSNMFPKSSFSSLETYGHWMLERYPDEMHREYEFNEQIKSNDETEFRNLITDKFSSNRSASLRFEKT